MENIYDNIKKYREDKGMSQDTLAELTGYSSRSSIAKIEKGLVDLQYSKIFAFANALEVSPIELMDLDETPSSNDTYFNSAEYTVNEMDEIKKYAEFIKNKRNKENKEQHFTDVNDAIKYLEKETSSVAAFNGDTSNAEVILQMANAVYLNRNK